MGGRGEGSSRNMYKGHVDKVKGGKIKGGGGKAVMGWSGGGKWRQLYLNTNKKRKKENGLYLDTDKQPLYR